MPYSSENLCKGKRTLPKVNDLNAKQIGETAERTAAKFLKKNGYRILEKNLSTKLGEIDILAVKKDILVVVEVKGTTGNSEFGPAVFRVNVAKQNKLRRLANQIIQKYRLRTTDIRFDVVTVDLSKGKKGVEIIENAFR